LAYKASCPKLIHISFWVTGSIHVGIQALSVCSPSDPNQDGPPSSSFLNQNRLAVLLLGSPLKMTDRKFAGNRGLLSPLSAQPRPRPYPASGREPGLTTAPKDQTTYLCILVLEPIGSSLPKFPSENKIQTLSRRQGDSSALICPAQAAPVPVFRCQCYKTYLLICRQSPSAERHLSFPPTTGPQPTLPDKRRKTSA
jgi:hypothetical protein